MGGVGLAAWSLQDFLYYPRVGTECDQAILAFVFLGAAFPAQLVGGAAGEALALRTFADGLDVGESATFGAQLGYGEARQGK